MKTFKLFALILAFAPLSLQAQAPSKACDESQEITVTMTVAIDDATLKDLKAKNVEELTLTPTIDLSWDKAFSLKNGEKITLKDTGEALAEDLEEGLLVTYPKGEEDIVYAYCYMDEEALKGELPKDLKLTLSPVLGSCKVDVVSTQCPKKK